MRFMVIVKANEDSEKGVMPTQQELTEMGAYNEELVAGFWILEVSSREEVLEWVRKAPFREGEVEVRQVASAEDFGDAMTPELREQEDRLRATVEAQHGA